MNKTELYLLRRKKKIKLRQLADYMGCSISLLSLYENDKFTFCDTKEYNYREYIINYVSK